MSFRCHVCGTSTAPREPLTRAVIKRRPKTVGWEIAKQAQLGPCCAHLKAEMEADAERGIIELQGSPAAEFTFGQMARLS